MKINQKQNQILEDQFSKLPPELRKAIADSAWEKKILAIGKRNGLHIDQLGVLQSELALAISGLIDFDEFFAEIQKRLSITSSVAQDVVDGANAEIFSVIRDRLKYYLENKDDAMGHEEKSVLQNYGIDIHEEDAETETSQETNRVSSGIDHSVFQNPQESQEEAVGLAGVPSKESVPEKKTEDSLGGESGQVVPIKQESETPEIAVPQKPETTSTYSNDPYRETVE